MATLYMYTYLLTACPLILLVNDAGGQVTQCNTDEYRAVVMNLESLRAQFKLFQEQTNVEISKLVSTLSILNETIQGLETPQEDVFDLRLVNGNVSSEGRVEVLHGGIWGTICDDWFDDNDAAVICRYLGYSGNSVSLDEAHFGAGGGPIWMDELECSGTEASPVDCPQNGWGMHDCEHDEDAGVQCNVDL